MPKVLIEDGKLKYHKHLKSCELPLERIVWAYLQQEDASAKMCCGRVDFAIGRVIVMDTDGRKETFQFEGMDRAKELLARIVEAKPDLCVGYAQENRRRWEGQG